MIAVWLFLKRIPWQLWTGIGLLVFIVWLRSYWIGVGLERCQEAQKAAQAKADALAAKQEIAAPAIAQEAHDAVEPKVIERTRVIRETIQAKPLSCPAYDERVYNAIREAETAINNVRPVPRTDK